MRRILQIVGNLNRGGAETWLMQVLRGINREKFHFDFVVHTDGPWDYGAEAEALGAKVLVCRGHNNPWKYALSLADILHTHGPYDCIHAHIHYFSGLPLFTARLFQVPVRIVHGHLDSSWLDGEASLFRRAYIYLMRRLIWSSCTSGVAVSTVAGDTLFPSHWRKDPKWSLQPCGIDLGPYREPINRQDVLQKEGIPEDAVVVGHVGRFHAQKNHSFLLDVASATVKIMPNAMFLLIGEGPLLNSMKAKAQELELEKHVRFLGVREDIARLMRGAMDVFLFPSCYEGLPLALLEAQASGLPCLLSDRVSPEADVIGPLMSRESLSTSPDQWARRLVSLCRNSETCDARLPELWSIQTSIATLEQAYQGEPQQAVGRHSVCEV